MPTQLGKYTLQRKIGAGGMADVWLAQGPIGSSGTGVCVLKCPHPHLCGNAEFVRMFLDEASLLAQLHHPGIAQIFDLGQVNGAYFMAMEFVDGFDLMSISLEHERHGELMGAELCARIVADAAGALHYAHEAKGKNGLPLNIVHRDVTPHNILLSRQGVVKLIDFGVAKASHTMHRTQAGFVKGKYPYMSPEQITGQVIDRRVDVYALGLVLYELLTNVRAIPGNNEVEQIDAARAGRIRPIEQLRPNVPVPLRQILGGCLHHEVEGRYPTALALKEDLEKFLTLERQVVGQEDLLRLFRVVAADVGLVGNEVNNESRPTEQDQPVSGSGVVVLPDKQLDQQRVDELGYSSTLPSMQAPAVTPLQPSQQVNSKSGPVPVQSGTPPRASKGPMIALGGLSVVIIGLVLALWQPWVKPSDPIVATQVDAGTGVPDKLERFTFPPEVDAGAERVAEIDAGAAEEVDAGAALIAEVADAGAVEADQRAAIVNVTSVVEADVLVDGKRFGRTPQELELAPGAHIIIVRGQGVEKKVTWKLKPGETKALDVPAPSAEPPAIAKKGKLLVNAPPFCALSVDGKSQPGAPVAKWNVELNEGKHKVSCKLEDASLPKPRIKTQVVTITGGEESTVEFNMLTD